MPGLRAPSGRASHSRHRKRLEVNLEKALRAVGAAEEAKGEARLERAVVHELELLGIREPVLGVARGVRDDDGCAQIDATVLPLAVGRVVVCQKSYSAANHIDMAKSRENTWAVRGAGDIASAVVAEAQQPAALHVKRLHLDRALVVLGKQEQAVAPADHGRGHAVGGLALAAASHLFPLALVTCVRHFDWDSFLCSSLYFDF